MDLKKIHLLESMPVKRAVLTLIVPTILSMIVQIFYNLTDTFFIGKLNDPYQVAAVTLTLPIFMMLMSISGIFAQGASSFISRLLGEKEYLKAKEVSSLALFIVLITGIIVSIFGTFYIDKILNLMGTSQNTLLFTKKYLLTIVLGSIPIMLNFSISQFMRSEGSAKTALVGMLIGTGLNILLDPLFIFGFHQGVTGAAIATVIGNSCALLYYISYYLKGKSLASPSIKHIKFKFYYVKEIVKIGFPSSLSQIMMSIGQSLSFSLASGYGDHALAAMGVAQRVITIPIFIFIGLAAGIQPLVGYSYGAKNIRRLKDTIKFSLVLSVAISGFFVLLFILFSKYTIILFIKDPLVVKYGSEVLRIFTFAIPFAAIQMLFMICLQALGKALPSLIISLCRQGIIFIPSIIILNHFWAFNGLIVALPLTDFISSIISLAFFYKVYKRLPYENA